MKFVEKAPKELLISSVVGYNRGGNLFCAVNALSYYYFQYDLFPTGKELLCFENRLRLTQEL
jgi:hypothetical protein